MRDISIPYLYGLGGRAMDYTGAEDGGHTASFWVRALDVAAPRHCDSHATR